MISTGGTCWHCETEPVRPGEVLCEGCLAVRCVRHLYKMAKYEPPGWNERLTLMRRRAEKQEPLFTGLGPAEGPNRTAHHKRSFQRMKEEG